MFRNIQKSKKIVSVFFLFQPRNGASGGNGSKLHLSCVDTLKKKNTDRNNVVKKALSFSPLSYSRSPLKATEKP